MQPRRTGRKRNPSQRAKEAELEKGIRKKCLRKKGDNDNPRIHREDVGTREDEIELPRADDAVENQPGVLCFTRDEELDNSEHQWTESEGISLALISHVDSSVKHRKGIQVFIRKTSFGGCSRVRNLDKAIKLQELIEKHGIEVCEPFYGWSLGNGRYSIVSDLASYTAVVVVDGLGGRPKPMSISVRVINPPDRTRPTLTDLHTANALSTMWVAQGPSLSVIEKVLWTLDMMMLSSKMQRRSDLWYSVTNVQITKMLGIHIENEHWFQRIGPASQRAFVKAAKSVEHGRVKSILEDIVTYYPSNAKEIRQEAFFNTIDAIHFDYSVASIRSEEKRNDLIHYRDKLIEGDMIEFPKFRRQSSARTLQQYVKSARSSLKTLVKVAEEILHNHPTLTDKNLALKNTVQAFERELNQKLDAYEE